MYKVYGSQCVLAEPQRDSLHFATEFRASGWWPVSEWSEASIIEASPIRAGEGPFFYWRAIPRQLPPPDVMVKVGDRPAGYWWREQNMLIASDWPAAPWEMPVTRAILRRLGYGDFHIPFACGADIEFEAWCRHGWRPANCALRGLRAGLNSPIGVDYDPETGELRPQPGTAVEVYHQVLGLAELLLRNGVVPVLSGDDKPLGGHIHCGPHPSAPGITVIECRDFTNSVGLPADTLLYRPAAPLNGRARGEYRVCCAWEFGKIHGGYEYRSPPAGIFADRWAAITAMEILRRLTEAYVNQTALSEEAIAALARKYRSACRRLREKTREYPVWTFGGIPVPTDAYRRPSDFDTTVAQVREWLDRTIDELSGIQDWLAKL